MQQPSETMPTEEIVAFKERLVQGDVELVRKLVAYTTERALKLCAEGGIVPPPADDVTQSAIKSDGAYEGVLLDRASRLPGREWPHDLHRPSIWAMFLEEIETSEAEVGSMSNG